jgi:apolipoprotein N-acyltransferase
VTTFRQYLAGSIGAGLLGLLAVMLARPLLRAEIGAGVLAGFLVQAPLGWWTLRSIGTERFQLVWVGGMIIRLAVVGLAALVLAPIYRWDTGAMLLALVATLLVLLMVEAVTAVREHSRAK